MNFFTAVHTDIGIKKSTNQDSALVMEAETDIGNVLLTVICDGMGGLAKGEVASSAVIWEFSQWFEKQLPAILSLSDPKDRIFSSWEKIVYACIPCCVLLRNLLSDRQAVHKVHRRGPRRCRPERLMPHKPGIPVSAETLSDPRRAAPNRASVYMFFRSCPSLQGRGQK